MPVSERALELRRKPLSDAALEMLGILCEKNLGVFVVPGYNDENFQWGGENSNSNIFLFSCETLEELGKIKSDMIPNFLLGRKNSILRQLLKREILDHQSIEVIRDGIELGTNPNIKIKMRENIGLLNIYRDFIFKPGEYAQEVLANNARRVAAIKADQAADEEWIITAQQEDNGALTLGGMYRVDKTLASRTFIKSDRIPGVTYPEKDSSVHKISTGSRKYVEFVNSGDVLLRNASIEHWNALVEKSRQFTIVRNRTVDRIQAEIAELQAKLQDNLHRLEIEQANAFTGFADDIIAERRKEREQNLEETETVLGDEEISGLSL